MVLCSILPSPFTKGSLTVQMLLCHPASVAGLPTDCQQVEGSVLPGGPGRCRYYVQTLNRHCEQGQHL